MIIYIYSSFINIFEELSIFSKNLGNLINNTEIQFIHLGNVDSPILGGGGMCFSYDKLIPFLQQANGKKVFLSPDGIKLKQKTLKSISEISDDLHIFLTRYEGYDGRLNDYVDFNISIGDFISSNAEIASLVFLDAFFRYKGTVKKHSLIQESFEKNLLDTDCFSKSKLVSQNDYNLNILTSGNHKEINLWKLKYSLFKTAFFRPDLLLQKKLNKEEYDIIQSLIYILKDL